MYIECINGFLHVSSSAIIQGEVFKLVDKEKNTFVGVEGASRYPDMEVGFTEQQLADNFKLTLTTIRL